MRTPDLGAVRRVVVYGSLAYDRVMFYPGRFRDALLPDKLHLINVSFAVPTIVENFGGTAGNIAYNLALLGVPVEVRSSVGSDFAPYRRWLRRQGVGLKLRTVPGVKTAAAYITTDKDDNQITAFHAGALVKPLPPQLRSVGRNTLVVVAPGNRDDMVALARYCRAHHVPYVFDPGQQVPALTREELLAGIRGAYVFIGNDYEVSLVARRLKLPEPRLRSLVPLLVRTLGASGSELWHNGVRVRIPAAKPATIADPTGAGDAYRAGLTTGLLRGFSLAKSGRLAALIAAHTVEQYGTQTHHFTWAMIKRRYLRTFSEML